MKFVDEAKTASRPVTVAGLRQLPRKIVPFGGPDGGDGGNGAASRCAPRTASTRWPTFVSCTFRAENGQPGGGRDMTGRGGGDSTIDVPAGTIARQRHRRAAG
jgi:GTP-binding protein